MAADLHERVAQTILDQLASADPGAWSPPWHGADPLPRNALTGKRYRGLNILALWCTAQTQGYPDARWATYRQWAALGAQVRRGERGTLILFYQDRGAHGSEPDCAPARTDTPAVPRRYVARASTVFNIAQVEGAPPLTVPAETPVAPLHMFDAFVVGTGAAIAIGGGRACYVPATDTIHLPERSAFHSVHGYAGTVAHELVHWTGAPHRLVRDLSVRFGTRSYAAEELVAELGAAFVLAELELARTPHPDHAAYCASWTPLLQSDPGALAHAAAQASRAVDWLIRAQTTPSIGRQPDDERGTAAAARITYVATGANAHYPVSTS